MLAAIFTARAVVAGTALDDPNWVGTAPKNISQSETEQVSHPAIAIGPSGLMIAAWSDEPSEGSTKDNIYVVSSSDSGSSWTSPTVVSETTTTSQLPDVLIVDNKTFVAWAEREAGNVFKIYETETGSGNVHPIPISEPDTSSDWSTRPSIVASSDRLHIVFNAGDDSSHILYASRLWESSGWYTATRIYTSTTDKLSWFPKIAIGPKGKKIHVVWEEQEKFGDVRAVMHINGTIEGPDGTWQDPITLSEITTTAVKPDLAIGPDGDVHVVWGEVVESERSYSYVRYRRYEASTDSWTSSMRIDPNPVYVNEVDPTDTAPRLALYEDGHRVSICVVWHGDRDTEQTAEEVLVSCSQDEGESWSSPQNLSRTPSDVSESDDISIWPSITFDSLGTLHSVWKQRVDSATSQYEIYYSHELSQVFLPLVLRKG